MPKKRITTSSTIEKGVYKHSKTGNLYEVIGIALHSESSEELVVYRPIRNDGVEYFVRPYAMFVEEIVLRGAKVPRFKKSRN